MPLLNGKRFEQVQPPADMDPDEEVFFSPVTFEIFRSYDDYFERTIQVNSVTWHCGVCGRGPSTFTDAVACEKDDRRDLNAFCPRLTAGLLYIIYQSKRQRLAELIELLCGFTATRFFVGEIVLYSTANTKERFEGCIKRVVLAPAPAKGERDRTPLGANQDNAESAAIFDSFAPGDVLYQVQDANPAPSGDNNKVILLPHTKLFRRAKNAVVRDRVRFFIRHTCELRDGCFSPKISFMRLHGIHPFGPVTWANLFLSPEPNWGRFIQQLLGRQFTQQVTGVVSNRSQSALEKKISSSKPSLNKTTAADSLSKVQQKSVLFNSHSISVPERKQSESSSTSSNVLKEKHDPASTIAPAWRAERLERMELEREWALVRRREDLELSDLVPLPEFPLFQSRIPHDVLGSAFQLLEFFHVFSNHLKLPSLHTLGGPLSWSEFESTLVDSDPTGPLADLLISMLCTIRRLDAEINNRPLPPSIIHSTYASAAAVAAAEADSSFSAYYFGHTTEFSTVYEDLVTGLNRPLLLPVLKLAASATRFNELVGIPSVASSQAAGKAAVAVAALTDDASETASKDDDSTGHVGTRKHNIRAATMAIHAGAASLCPLDRASLSKALWLHIACAAAKFNSFRGQIWGGARPLDDPTMMFAREHPMLLDKLATVSVYELEVHEKILLLTCLMDQLLLYPSMRDLYEKNFEQQRTLRNKLRNLHSLHPPVASSEPSNKPEENSSAISSANTDSTKGSRSDSSSQQPTAGNEGNKSLPAILPKPEASNISSEEEALRKAIVDASRNCCMLPLGQDRFYRRYWILLSLPAILVEDDGLQLQFPASPRKITHRQVASVDSTVANELALTSAEAAARRLREFVATLSEPLSRDSITYKLASKLPPSLTQPTGDLNQLRMLVKPERSQTSDRQFLSQNHAFMQCERRNSRLLVQPDSSKTVWYVVKSRSNEAPTNASNVGPAGDCNSTIDRATWALDCVEASLNARGVREARLRRTVGQMRPILIQTVACSDELKMSVKTENPVQKPDTQSILLGWLEIAIRRLARRLYKADTIRSVLKVESNGPTTTEESPDDSSPSPATDRFLYTRALPHNERFRFLSEALLKLGLSIGPNVMIGPISDENRTLRGVPQPQSEFNPAPVYSNLMTGWQRWCSSVKSARSCSELHLLARALERGVRRAPMKRKKQRLTEPTLKCIPVKILCTACRSPPDPVPNSSVSQTTVVPFNGPVGGHHIPLATCAGCCAPFHVECLKNSHARPRRSKRRHCSKHLPSPQNPVDMESSMIGYCSVYSALSSVTAARMETTCGSVYLCNSCTRVTGTNPLAESTPTDQLTGDEDWDSVSVSSDHSTDEPLQTNPVDDIKNPVDEKRKSLPQRKPPPPKTRPPTQRRPLNLHKMRSSAPVKRKPVVGKIPSRHSLRQRVRKSDDQTEPPSKRRRSPCTNSTSESVEAPAVEEDTSCVKERLVGEKFVFNGHGLELDNEVVINLPFLKKATVILSPCDSSTKLINSACHRDSRATKKAQVNYPAVQTSNTWLNKQEIEQLFAELCNSSSARPLLRCGLGRTITTEEYNDRKSKETQPQATRHSLRRQSATDLPRSASTALYAWDLQGLQDLLSREGFPGGPAQAVEQLRLLLKHWLNVNRPGSRLYQCAHDVSRQLEAKLIQLEAERKP